MGEATQKDDAWLCWATVSWPASRGGARRGRGLRPDNCLPAWLDSFTFPASRGGAEWRGWTPPLRLHSAAHWQVGARCSNAYTLGTARVARNNSATWGVQASERILLSQRASLRSVRFPPQPAWVGTFFRRTASWISVAQHNPSGSIHGRPSGTAKVCNRWRLFLGARRDGHVEALANISVTTSSGNRDGSGWHREPPPPPRHQRTRNVTKPARRAGLVASKARGLSPGTLSRTC